MRPTTSVLGFISLLACANVTELGQPGTTVRRAALTVFYGDTSLVTVSSSTTLTEPLTVEFITFAGGCIAKGETEVTVSGLEAQLRPYQYEYYPRANEACTEELRLDRNVVTVQFTTPGAAQIRIFGLVRPGDREHTLERSITVNPWVAV